MCLEGRFGNALLDDALQLKIEDTVRVTFNLPPAEAAPISPDLNRAIVAYNDGVGRLSNDGAGAIVKFTEA